MSKNTPKLLYARLKGIQGTLQSQPHCSAEVLRNYNKIVTELGTTLDEDLSDFAASQSLVYLSVGKEHLCKSGRLLEKANELVAYLEVGHGINTNIVEIGSLYNAIHDSELKERCADILSAPGSFDRVINQATQVLEDRIRRLGSGDRNCVGAALVAAVIGVDPVTSRLAVSHNRDEQEGVFHILRGIMIGFRNPSHHHISSAVTREQALKVCGFVDFLLELLGKATLNKP